MATSTLRIQGQISGLVSGAKAIDLTLTSSGGELRGVTLASGANTITVPSGVTRTLLVPPSANTVAMTLKGVTGDTGIGLAVATPILLTHAVSTGTTFVVSAGGAIVGVEVIHT